MPSKVIELLPIKKNLKLSEFFFSSYPAITKFLFDRIYW